MPGPPEVIDTSARTLGEILVTFYPTPVSSRNGIVTSYTVNYEGPTGNASVTVPDSFRPSVTLRDLTPGAVYRVRVAATNGAGTGPFGSLREQTTLPLPPPIPAEGFQRNNGRSVTQTTIPVLLPSIADPDSYRYDMHGHTCT